MNRYAYPRLFAHRGGGSLAPENTLAGMRLAARLGYRGVEFDVMLSADGAPVLIHDERFERTTDGAGLVAQTPLAALRRLDAGVRFHPAFAGEVMPTLEEALALCASLHLTANVEIKPAEGADRATGATVGRIVAASPAGAVLLSSFSEEALAAARLAAPDCPRAWLTDVPPPDWSRHLDRLGCQGLHCAASQLTPELTAALVGAAIPFACYTVNDPAAAAALFAAGAAAIFTDRLDLFDPAAAELGRR
ncbi:glycerophosphoryl diester phosphodiesterase [mine drainage metagenome]|uniref:Glycerophosphoryl diester phosphodiesterase n=1 Tax=mine drainage metagenome TaxID=410659 RepID=A0A1J5S7B6_9ZZZZ